MLSKLHFVVDNITSLGVNFAGLNIENKLNITVMLISALQSIKKINAILVVELLPCTDHPGYTYNAEMKICTCIIKNIYNKICSCTFAMITIMKLKEDTGLVVL